MKKIKAAVIGLGRIGRMGHIPELLACPEEFEITAVADHVPERLENLPDGLGKVKKYPDLKSLLEDDDVEMITIGVRHADHVPMALEILNAGKIAVVEKPIATSVAEMDVLLDAGRKHPGKLFFRHNRRFEPAFIKVRQLIGAGIIGEVQYVKLYRSVGYCRRNDWMTMTEFYGGLLSNWGPHLIDQALQLLDSPVIDLWADVRHVISIGDGDDLFKILLKAENGRVADVEVTGANTMPGREMEIIGTRGTIVFNGGKIIDVKRIDPAVELKELAPHPENPPVRYGNFDETLYFVEEKYQVPDVPAHEIWKHIWKSVAEGVPFPVTPDQAREVVRVTEEAFKKSGFAPIRKFKPKTKLA